ncbi:MAG: VOC family protein [Rubrobacter sp.]|nr:VOC family protein [Rubrobacter sp.]
MLHGLRTAIYAVDDIERAKGWYEGVLGFGPYFDEPFYVGFDVGGFELGLSPDEENTDRSGAGVTVYWGVDDAEAAVGRLLELGASEGEAVRDVGDGILVATVFDPFENVFGVIENPHFEEKDG